MADFTSAFFVTFGVIQLVAILLVGPALAAGTIAQERERRTMEYLYASPLSNLEIILGKLGGRVLHILFLVLAGVPVLALAMLLGGIAPEKFVALTGITLSTVLFVTMVSMAVSAWTARPRRDPQGLPALLLPLDSAAAGDPALQVQPSIFLRTRPIVSAHQREPALRLRVDHCARQPVGTGDRAVGTAGQAGTHPDDNWRDVAAAGGDLIRRVHLREAGKGGGNRRWRFQVHRGRIGNDPMYWKERYAVRGLRGWASWATDCWH